MTTFITMLADADGGAVGPRLAVKDLIDVAGVPTTAGSRAVADTANPAAADAACMAGARAASALIVGKTNLFELAYGASGINEWFGTPRNPLDPALVPGGSSSGSAVALANGEADISYGSDTGGSIRIPAAFCGITGLKTTHGRIPVSGVWPLAPSLDTVGPMARDVAGVAAGMTLLEPGFRPGDAAAAGRVGRLRLGRADPRIDAAVDDALAASGLYAADAALPGWQDALRATGTIIDVEAAESNASLMADPVARAKLGAGVRAALAEGATVPRQRLRRARDFQQRWQATVADALSRVALLALPTVLFYPPPLAEASGPRYTYCTAPFNLAGVPALALPVPSSHRLPASLQLVGPAGSEAMLLATGAVIEAAVGYVASGS
jgi:amidase